MEKRSVRLLLVALSAGLFVNVLTAQGPVSQTPAGQQLARWLDTFNAGNRDSWQQFVRDVWPSKPSQEIDRDITFRGQTGGFTLLRIEEATATRAVALVNERDSDTVARLVVEVDGTAPHAISSVRLQAIPRPPDLAIPRLTESELVKALGAQIDKQLGADRFAGAVLVAHRGKPIFAGAYGSADRDAAVPNTLDTRFRNGSMNKMFTAAAVLTLVQARKLALDDPLGKHLPDYPNKTVASKVTIHHLMTHTGGTGDIFGPQFAARRLELRTHQDYVNLYGTRDLEFEPGSQWRYSNYGFVLLGVIIEKVSGQSYYDYVRDHVYAPAGMTSTGSEPEEKTVPPRSIGYTRRPGTSAWLPNIDTLPYRGTAAGGGYTTVEDLSRFASAITNNKLLNAENTALLITGKVDAGSGKYAYGFIDRTANGLRAVGHGGGAPGMNGDLLIFPDSGYVVTVLCNLDPPAAQRISDFIANRLPAR